jgi:hypothetical protein
MLPTAAHDLLCVALVLLANVGAGASTLNGFDLSGAAVPAEQIELGGPPRDGIPAIDRPKFLAAKDAKFLRPEDRVVGVHYHGITRAYPISILNWHEVVNDNFNKEAIVITFCPLCGTGMVFRANIGGRALRFGVSGLLYNSDVLLYDRQTQSLWSQIASVAISGPMKGKLLEAIPVSHTTWADWRARHPNTDVLSQRTGYSRHYDRDPYAGYAQEERLYFPVSASSRRYHPKEQVIGLRIGKHHKAYPFVELARSVSPIHDEIGGKAVRIEFDGTIRTGRIFDAAGREIPSVIAFWFAWYAFHPQTDVFVSSARDRPVARGAPAIEPTHP